MGWGTTFKPGIYLSRFHFDSAYDIEDAIEELEEDIQRAKESLMMLAASRPSDISEEGYNPLDYVRIEFMDTWNLLREDMVKLTNLCHLKEFLEDNPGIDVKKLQD